MMKRQEKTALHIISKETLPQLDKINTEKR
jgi:hypothetical protein